jgi:hypothetical protein
MRIAALVLALSAAVAAAQDIGSIVNGQLAALPTVVQNGQTWAQGTVTIPAGNYVQTTTILIASPYVDLACAPGAILTYMGSGDAIRILPPQVVAGDLKSQPNRGPSVSNCSIYAGSFDAKSGIHAGDLANIRLVNVSVNGFTGGSSTSAFWLDNTKTFTEGAVLEDLKCTNNSICLRFTAGAFNSFGYTEVRNLRAAVRTKQTAVSVENNVFLYHSYIDATAETADSTGTFVKVSGTGRMGGPGAPNFLMLRGECVSGTGACFGATFLNLGATTQFSGTGWMNWLTTTMQNVVAPGASITWTGFATPAVPVAPPPPDTSL